MVTAGPTKSRGCPPGLAPVHPRIRKVTISMTTFSMVSNLAITYGVLTSDNFESLLQEVRLALVNRLSLALTIHRYYGACCAPMLGSSTPHLMLISLAEFDLCL